MTRALAYFLDLRLRLRLRGRPEGLALVDRCLRLIARAEAAGPGEIAELVARFRPKPSVTAMPEPAVARAKALRRRRRGGRGRARGKGPWRRRRSPMTASPPASPAAASKRATAGPDATRGWTDAAIERLKALWAEGDLSAALIGRRLGVTRNAVLGKVHRLGLSNRRAGAASRPSRPRRVATPRTPTPAPKVRKGPVERPPARSASTTLVDIGPGLAVRLEDIPHRGCHWPIGDPHAEDFRFCGRRARLAPYCDAHRAVAYRPGGAKPAEGLLKAGGA